MSVKVVRVKLTKDGLAAMPQADRSLLLLLGHVTNELNVLHKIMLAMLRDTCQPHEIKIIHHGQALIVMRLLIGKLHAAWELFTRRVLSSKRISAEYLPGLPEDALEALAYLKRHFGAGSPLTTIRNKLSFHSSDDDNLLEESFQALPASEQWDFYLGDEIANTFYYASELVMTKTAAELGGGFPDMFTMTLHVADRQLLLLER